MTKFYNLYGLINAHANEVLAENTLLFSIEYYMLTKDEAFLEKILIYLNNCKVQKGLYNQHPIPQPDKGAFMSHDQLTAIVALFHSLGMKRQVQEIWSELKRQWFRYDNTNPKAPSWNRIMHPRDIIYYGYCAENVLCKALYPILALCMIITCIQSYKVRNNRKIIKTDGKLLSWVRCKGSKLHRTFKLLTWIISSNSYFVCWRNIFLTYFGHEQHPIHKLLK